MSVTIYFVLSVEKNRRMNFKVGSYLLNFSCILQVPNYFLIAESRISNNKGKMKEKNAGEVCLGNRKNEENKERRKEIERYRKINE